MKNEEFNEFTDLLWETVGNMYSLKRQACAKRYPTFCPTQAEVVLKAMQDIRTAVQWFEGELVSPESCTLDPATTLAEGVMQ
jgi:hypothetical protein